MEQDVQNKVLRILQLEDVATDAELALHAIRNAGIAFVSTRVDTREAFIAALTEFKPDVVLADYRLPDFDGHAALDIVRREHPEVPVVMVSGTLGDEVVTYLLKAGARDYVLKDNLARLGHAVQRALSEEMGIRQRKAAEQALRETLQRVQDQLQVVGVVAGAEALISGEVEQVARAITELTAKATGCERVSAWLFNDDETEVRCIDLYEATPAQHSAGMVMRESEYRHEFQALKGSRYMNADDPLTDTRTSGCVETYLKPLRITSMLDAVVHVSGRNLGLLCFEHVAKPHHWEQDEISFACQLADKLGLALINRQRLQAERSLQRVNRALRVLSESNTSLVHAVDESSLLNEVCRIIVESGGYRMAWVGFAEQDEGRTVRPMARHGHEEGYLGTTPVTWADTELGRGPTGAAIRAGVAHVNQNTTTNPLMAPWRAAALERGYAACIALPLRHASGILGALTLYASEPEAFDAEEITLLQELADDLAFGIVTLRTRAERDHIAEQHQHHEEILRRSLEESIQAIAATVEMRDPYTAGHQQRVAQLSVAIARELGLAEERIHGLHLAAGIHDLGKIHIPSELLSKPGKLSTIEFELIKVHPQVGYDIIKDVQFPWPIADMILQHHERLDGSGYPNGLRSEQLLTESKILAVADVVEAMASYRPYRPGLGIGAALAEIGKHRGVLFDEAAVDACIRLFREQRFSFDEPR